MLTFRLSCDRICSKHPQHWHHASLLVSDMLYWPPGSWRCYQQLLLGQLPRGRFRPESSHSARSPIPPLEELCCACSPTSRSPQLWSCAAKHTVTLPTRWVRTAAPLEGPFRLAYSEVTSSLQNSKVYLSELIPQCRVAGWHWSSRDACEPENNWAGTEGWLTFWIVFWVQNPWQ